MNAADENLEPTMSENEADLHESQLAMIFAALMDRVQSGQQVDLGVECHKHPEFADELRQLWGTVMVTQTVGQNYSESDQPMNVVGALFELPTQFGKYTLLEEVGRGGMGVIYRARHEESESVSPDTEDSDCALKMILHGDQATETTRRRFHAEARAAKGLDHPNIIHISDVGEHDGRAYFCMDLIQGESLAERLARGPMPPRQTARIIMQVARAIDFAHSHGVLHRDLKPSNILIADENNRPFVVDFGLARDVTANESLTRTGSVIGTPAYMAPEQAAGARGQVNSSSDVYSLGAIMYHMLTGRPPFQASSPVDTVLMLLEQDPIAPRVLNRNANRQLEMIAMRCLQKPQDLRYRSASALADDLERFLNQEAVQAQQGRLGHVIASMLRDTHQASIMENWGRLWMWHALVLFLACAGTQLLHFVQVSRWVYWFLWTAGFGAWAMVFWNMRRRMGPVTFIERQIAHLWLGSIVCIGAVFPFEWYLGLPALSLAPVLSLVAAMIFLVKASMLSGVFYIQATALFVTAFLMAVFDEWALLIFGTVSAGCFYFAGHRYYQRVDS